MLKNAPSLAIGRVDREENEVQRTSHKISSSCFHYFNPLLIDDAVDDAGAVPGDAVVIAFISISRA